MKTVLGNTKLTFNMIVRLPLPVVTAVRRELEKAGVLQPGPHLHLTGEADRVIGEEWGWGEVRDQGSGIRDRGAASKSPTKT